ncbi:MAG: hypothetical protein IH995_04375 [Proteobacteria bacterium]|nr:hypothetical protein [Pseudomonadota bacterium]
MANIKPASLGLISFLMALFFLVLPARAENWVEMTFGGMTKFFYDSDSAYVDIATGLVVVKTAVWVSKNDAYQYTLTANDCSRWKYYFLGTIVDDAWIYDTDGNLEVSSISGPDTYIGRVAQWACDNYNNHPSGNIPFDFRLSNY